MADNQLAKVINFDLPIPNEHVNDDMFNKLVRPSFLSRLSLCTGSSVLVQEGKMGVGKYAFIRSKDDFIDMGEKLEVVPLALRFAAGRFMPDKAEMFYDPNSAEFKQVQSDSEQPNSRCAYGPQFLLYVPQLREFCSYLFGGKTSRPEGRKMKQILDNRIACTLRSKLMSNQNNRWHSPVIIPYNGVIEMPDQSVVIEQVTKFNNPGKSSVETEFAPQEEKETAAVDEGRPR